jgi:formylglycine-generating enzyme required for sulfatase activity
MPDSEIEVTPPQGILSDQPASEDQLNFAPYAKTLADIIADPTTATPLTIGVFGSWGQGKTSLMRMVERTVTEAPAPDFPVQPVWFNAWLYSQQQSLWRALISRVLNAAHHFPTLDDEARRTLNHLEARLYGNSHAGGGQFTVPGAALRGLSGVTLPPLMGLELMLRQAKRDGNDEAARNLQLTMADVEESDAHTRRDQIAALDDFRREFETISRKCIVNHGRLAVFVDDLDRCLPDKAVEVLEAIKLFLDVPGCVFVLGIAREVIEQGIKVRYRDYGTQLNGAEYLEKIIQIPFSLPPIDANAVQGYVNRIAGPNLPDPLCETVFSVGLEPNPRRIKRTLNIFLLLWRLAQNRPDLARVIQPVRLAKIVIIQQYHPRLFELITGRPYLLIDLEQRFRSMTKETSEALERGKYSTGTGTGTGEADISAGPLQDFLTNSLLRALLTSTPATAADANFIDINAACVRDHIYFTHSAVEETTPTTTEAKASPFEPQMVTIPAGKFLMGTSDSELKEIAKLDKDKQYQDWIKREVPQHEVTLPAYAIGRYPVTNAEFKRFIDDGGYTTQDYWTEAGWKQKESETWTKPRYWGDAQWNDPSQPVVGVSWYEAVAYCNWLGKKTGKPYRLPTEAEWEYAARGKEGSRYPWNNQWDKTKCNNKENGADRTTPVGQFSPQGDSSFGVGDMVGQVWEWCSTKFAGYPYKTDDGREENAGDDARILRGGSWYDNPPSAYCRCGYRGWNDPRLGYNGRGISLCQNLSSISPWFIVPCSWFLDRCPYVLGVWGLAPSGRMRWAARRRTASDTGKDEGGGMRQEARCKKREACAQAAVREDAGASPARRR